MQNATYTSSSSGFNGPGFTNLGNSNFPFITTTDNTGGVIFDYTDSTDYTIIKVDKTITVKPQPVAPLPKWEIVDKGKLKV